MDELPVPSQYFLQSLIVKLWSKIGFILLGGSHLQLHNRTAISQPKIWWQVIRIESASSQTISKDFSTRTEGGRAVSHWNSWSKSEDSLLQDFSATTQIRLKLFRCKKTQSQPMIPFYLYICTEPRGLKPLRQKTEPFKQFIRNPDPGPRFFI